MTWNAVAYKDFQDAVRSRSLLVLTVLLALFIGLASFAFARLLSPDQPASMTGLLFSLMGPSGFLIPILAILVSYRSIAGEREIGSMRFLLALPHTRRDVVVGKVVGRTAVVAVAVLVGFAVGGAVAVIYYEFAPLNYLVFTLLTFVLGLVYVSIGTGVSATTGSASRAAAGVLAVYVLFEYLWGVIGLAIVYVANGFSLDLLELPAWYEAFALLSPGTAYQWAMWNALPGGPDGGETPFVDAPGLGQFTIPEWAPFLVFAGWIGLALAVGYWRFERADLE